jgi:hypothetical protein
MPVSHGRSSIAGTHLTGVHLEAAPCLSQYFPGSAEACEQAPHREDVEATKYEKTIWDSDQLPIVIILKNRVALVSGMSFCNGQRGTLVIMLGCDQGSGLLWPHRAPDAISHQFPPFSGVMICEPR